MKRLIISFIYLVLLAGLATLIYYKTRPKETCFDKIQNQNEEKVDCGGVCTPCPLIAEEKLQIAETGWVPSGLVGRYDIFGLISNPNASLGGKKFSYKFIVKSVSGSVLLEKNGESFILPGDKKYIIENNIELGGVPDKIELTLGDSEWVEFSDYSEKPQLKVVNKNYNEISGGVNFSEAIGLVRNESPFDFATIKIEVILRDAGGKIIAVNSTEMNTVRSGENREFKVIWPNRFPGSVANMDAQTEVNVFSSEAFAKRYFRSEKFQDLEIK